MRETLHRQIPVIVLTGDISTETLRRIASQDCVQLNKPVKAARELISASFRCLLPASHPPVRARIRYRQTSRKCARHFRGRRRQPRARGDSQLARSQRADSRGLCHMRSISRSLRSRSRRMSPGGRVSAGDDGSELLQRLHDGGYRLPAIMITGTATCRWLSRP